MKFLISGAAGFIGSHLADVVLQQGHQVVGLDNFATGSKANVALLETNSGFSFVEHDIVKPFATSEKFDRVLHFASAASPPDYQRLAKETLRVGSDGTVNMLEIAAKCGARFMLASTSEVYGDPLEHPQKETYWGNVNSVGPRSMYDEAKRFAEATTMAYSAEVEVRIVRIFNTYGPRMRLRDGRVVSNFIVQALNNEPLTVFGAGKQSRSFCYVSDEVAGILALLESDYSDGPVNVGNPNEFTIKQLAELVQKLLNPKASIAQEELPQDDPAQRQPDITLIKKLTGWEPTVSLEEGIEMTANDFRQRIESGI